MIKRYLEKYRDVYITSIALIVISILYWYNKVNDKEALGLFISISTVYFGLMKYRIENDRIFKQLFDSFNERYTTDFNNLITEIKNSEEYIIDLKGEIIIIDYFNLCAEEYLWYERGRLPIKVWKSWRSGILENLNIKQIRMIYNQEMKTENGNKSYYGLEKELRKHLI